VASVYIPQNFSTGHVHVGSTMDFGWGSEEHQWEHSPAAGTRVGPGVKVPHNGAEDPGDDRALADVASPESNGFSKRFHRTVKEDFYQMAFRKTL
jgi:hypothetical protein